MKGGKEKCSDSMNMGKKVVGSLSLLAIIVLIAGLIGIYGMSRIHKTLTEVVRVNLPGLTVLEIIHEGADGDPEG